jgi:hypothetical protein
VAASYLKASLLLEAFARGQTEIMPYVLAAHDVGVRPFAQIAREDRVERSFLPLLERLELPLFRRWVSEHFTSDELAL